MNFLCVKLKEDLLSHAVHFELEAGLSVSGVYMQGVQQCSCGNLFVLSSSFSVKTKPKVLWTVTGQFLLGLVGTAGPSLFGRQVTDCSVWGDRVSMKMNMMNAASKRE